MNKKLKRCSSKVTLTGQSLSLMRSSLLEARYQQLNTDRRQLANAVNDVRTEAKHF